MAETQIIAPELLAKARNGLELLETMLRGAQGARAVLAMLDQAQSTLDSIPARQKAAETRLAELNAAVPKQEATLLQLELDARDAETRSRQRVEAARERAEGAERDGQARVDAAAAKTRQAIEELDRSRQAQEAHWRERAAALEAESRDRLAALEARLKVATERYEAMRAQEAEMEARARALLGPRG